MLLIRYLYSNFSEELDTPLQKYRMVLPVIQIQNWSKQFQVNETLVRKFHKFRLKSFKSVTVRPIRLARLRDPSIRRRLAGWNSRLATDFRMVPWPPARIPRRSTGKSQPDENIYWKVEVFVTSRRAPGSFSRIFHSICRRHLNERSFWPLLSKVIDYREISGPCLRDAAASRPHFHRPIVSLGSRPLLLSKRYAIISGKRGIPINISGNGSRSSENSRTDRHHRRRIYWWGAFVFNSILDSSDRLDSSSRFQRKQMNLLNCPLLFKAPRAIVSNGDWVEYAQRV